jgi:hypothetical protein
MHRFHIVPALAAAIATPALAEPRTRTVTVDRPNYEGSRTTVRDPQAGTVSHDAEVARKSDGATATRSYDRVRTDTGFTASGSATGFDGKTRSFESTRTRTENGSVTNGTYTGRGAETYTLSGNRVRGEGGFSATQKIVKNSSGETIYNRDITATRANGQISRSVNVTRKQGVRPPRSLRGPSARRRGN